jgi:TPP-dependent pyruvate/acetoin dehydrogenase alpha subunit
MSLNAVELETTSATVVRPRRFDEKTAELFNPGPVKGTAHSDVGVAARNTPRPYDDALECATIPTRRDIAAAIRGIFQTCASC